MLATDVDTDRLITETIRAREERRLGYSAVLSRLIRIRDGHDWALRSKRERYLVALCIQSARRELDL